MGLARGNRRAARRRRRQVARSRARARSGYGRLGAALRVVAALLRAEGPWLPAAMAEGLRGCLREDYLLVFSGASKARGGRCGSASATPRCSTCAGRAAGPGQPGASPAVA
ncbi:rCG25179, partial [Rattus norvegicus]